MGDSLPDFALTTPDDRLITADDLRGHATVLTFVSGDGLAADPSREIVRRIDAALQRLRVDLRERVRPVAVSADGDGGRALVQRQATGSAGWMSLSGPRDRLDRLCLPLGVVIWSEDGEIAHTLRTFVVDPELRIVDHFPGTAPWTTADLLATLARAAR